MVTLKKKKNIWNQTLGGYRIDISSYFVKNISDLLETERGYSSLYYYILFNFNIYEAILMKCALLSMKLYCSHDKMSKT